MITLTKENITDYLRKQMPDLDFSKPLIISEIGEGTAEEDGDGYVNYVFRVSDGKRKMILKQGRSVGRVTGHTGMDLARTSIEYDYMKIGQVIVPEYIPELYFYDDENLVFAVEDVSYLKFSSISVSYSFPTKWVKAMKMGGVTTSFHMNNLFILTDYTGIDPETPGAVYPQSRSFTFSLSLSF